MADSPTPAPPSPDGVAARPQVRVAPRGVVFKCTSDAGVINQAALRVFVSGDIEHRRAFASATIRAAGAALEGFIASAKKACLAHHSAEVASGGALTFTEADLVCLREEEQRVFSLDSQGRADLRARPLALRFRDDLRFSADAAARAYRTTLDWGGMPEWGHVQRFIAVRDRLTHPRSEADLEVSLEDLQEVDGTLDWMIGVLAQLRSAATSTQWALWTGVHDAQQPEVRR